MADVGDTVTVHYTGTLDDGTVFDTSKGRDPLSFEIGSDEVIAGFDKAVRDLDVGESASVRVEATEAFGDHNPELVVAVPTDNAPDGLSQGDRVQIKDGGVATVVEVSDDFVTIDANHPLAGRPLNFEIELVSVE